MIPPPPLHDEAKRIASLRALRILDTPPEERFDRLTRMAQVMLDVPIALVSLVDEARQWFKSKQGLAASETPREVSFCGHTILGDGPFLVPDAALDPRFHDNPLVTKDPAIRFYAGWPLRTPDGAALGTFCVIDRRARLLTSEQLRILQDLAAIAEDQLTATDLIEALRRLREKEAHLIDLIENAHDLVQSVLPDGRFVYVNRRWRETLGYSNENLSKMTLFDVIHPESRAHCAEVLERVLRGATVERVEAIFKAKDGRSVWVSGNVNCSREDGTPGATRGIFRDITEERRIRDELHRTHSQLRAITEGTSDAIYVKDAQGHYLMINPAGARFLGRAPEDILGKDDLALFTSDTARGIMARDRGVLESGETRTYEDTGTAGGVTRTYLSTKGPFRDAGGKIVGLFGISRDITERKRSEELLERLATTDGLTGLTNGRHFRELLSREMNRARRSGSPLCLAMLDLDFFKDINDRLGHDTGDQALVHLAKVFRERLRTTDLIGRYGGDEFCLLLPDTTLDAACSLLDELRVRFAEHGLPLPSGEKLNLSCSIGVARMESGTADSGAFFSLADGALYRAKTAGRNRVAVPGGKAC